MAKKVKGGKEADDKLQEVVRQNEEAFNLSEEDAPQPPKEKKKK